MNYIAYIERQKGLIRGRHVGETYLVRKEECMPLSVSEKLLGELSSLKGLNTRERLKEVRAV